MRRPLAILVMASVAIVVMSATSIAVPSVVPSTITLQRGTTTATDHIAEVTSNDSSYFTVTATPAHGTYRAQYIATFAIPSTSTGLFLDWEGQAVFSCDFKMALYNWKRKRFVVGASGFITNTDDVHTQRAFPAKPYVRNLKVRARISCSIDNAFDLLTDSFRLKY